MKNRLRTRRAGAAAALVLIVAMLAGASWQGSDYSGSRSYWWFYTDSLTMLFPDATHDWRIYGYNVHLGADTAGNGAPFDTIRADSSWYASLPSGLYNIWCYTDSSATLMVDSVGILGPTVPPSMVHDDSTYAFLRINAYTAAVTDSLYAAKAVIPSLAVATTLTVPASSIGTAAVANGTLLPADVDAAQQWAFRRAAMDTLIGRSGTTIYANTATITGAVAVSAGTLTATSALNIPNASIKDHHLDLTDITFDGGDFSLTHGYLIQGNSSALAQQYESTGNVILHDGIATLQAGVVSETHLAVAATSPTYSMWSSCPLLAILADPATGFFWQEDFNWTATAHNGWTSTLTDAGSIIGPLVGYPYIAYGIDATDITVGDNDEGYYAAPGVFALAATKSVWCEANLEIIEGNTDDCNAWFGLTDQAALANFLQDNGAGPAASYDGIGFFKVDGGTVWQFETSDGASQTTDTDVGTRVSGTFVRLGFIVTSNTSVTAYVNGVNVASWATNLPDATTMKLIFAVKTGGTIKEYIYFDRARWVQLR